MLHAPSEEVQQVIFKVGDNLHQQQMHMLMHLQVHHIFMKSSAASSAPEHKAQ